LSSLSLVVLLSPIVVLGASGLPPLLSATVNFFFWGISRISIVVHSSFLSAQQLLSIASVRYPRTYIPYIQSQLMMKSYVYIN